MRLCKWTHTKRVIRTTWPAGLARLVSGRFRTTQDVASRARLAGRGAQGGEAVVAPPQARAGFSFPALNCAGSLPKDRTEARGATVTRRGSGPVDTRLRSAEHEKSMRVARVAREMQVALAVNITNLASSRVKLLYLAVNITNLVRVKKKLTRRKLAVSGNLSRFIRPMVWV